MKLINEYTLIVKKSKFIGLLFEISSDEDAKEILDELKKEHKHAKHFPYAYKLETTARKSDDKEPSNTAGLPILNVLERNNLYNNFIVIIRYFGGTKLGAGPLLRTYSAVANELIKTKSDQD